MKQNIKSVNIELDTYNGMLHSINLDAIIENLRIYYDNNKPIKIMFEGEVIKTIEKP